MKMVKMLIQVSQPIKDKLDAMRSNGYTASGYIRGLLENDFRWREEARKGRETLPEFRDLTPWKTDRQSQGQRGNKKDRH